MNVVAVDWRDGAGVLDYPQAASNTQLVGRQIAIFVSANQLSSVHLSGHSLGGQIAGYAGKYTNQLIESTDQSETRIHPIARITAMDPAGPMFELPSWVEVGDKAKIHVTSNDADFVDVIHTTGGSLVGDQGLGMESAVGHADIYPNGGQSQPGCRMSTDADSLRAEQIFEKFFFLIQDVLIPKRINIGLLQFLATVSKHGIVILMTHSLMAIAKREFSIRTGWDIVQQNHEFQQLTF